MIFWARTEPRKAFLPLTSPRGLAVPDRTQPPRHGETSKLDLMTDRNDSQKMLEVAQRELGPWSAELLSRPEKQALCLYRMREGQDLEDAVLSIIFDAARTDTDLANEFVAYFLPGCHRSGKKLIGRALERYLETNDLVQSVFTDFWGDLESFEFQGRAQFRAYLKKKIHWKASNYGRSKVWRDAREGRRVEAEGLLEGQVAEAPSQLSKLVGDEDRAALVLAIAKLAPRDQQIVRMHLRGMGNDRIGHELNLLPSSARAALSRALERVRENASRANRDE